jgi:hypothetical protein
VNPCGWYNPGRVKITRVWLDLTEIHRVRKTWYKEQAKKSYWKKGGNNQGSERNQRIQGKLLVKGESSRGISFQQRAAEGDFDLRFHTLHWILSGQSFLSEILRLHKSVRTLLKKQLENVLMWWILTTRVHLTSVPDPLG